MTGLSFCIFFLSLSHNCTIFAKERIHGVDVMKEKVLVGMSGGVDSTATCLLLQKQGYEVLGLTIRNHDLGIAGGCEEPCHIIEARQLAGRLGIRHFVADEREAFDRDVAMPFVRKWLDGLTPNPCVECNPSFKFRILLEWADRLGCEKIATGHYAGIVKDDAGRYHVRRGADSYKDQSYFLWKLDESVLSRTLFPIGGMTKGEVRSLLAEEGLCVKAADRESMEVCFIEKDYRSYLKSRIPDIDSRIGPGSFVDSTGKVIGEHKGYPYYTIGQRKGLEVAFGSPRYVLKTNPARNTVMLGLPEQLEAGHMLVCNTVFRCEGNKLTDGSLSVRIRYRSAAIPCVISGEVEPGLTLVRFLQTASAIAPGQAAVFYDGDIVAGGAEIASQRGINQYL